MLATERVKSEQYAAQCEAVADALDKLDKVLEAVAAPPGGEAAAGGEAAGGEAAGGEAVAGGEAAPPVGGA